MCRAIGISGTYRNTACIAAVLLCVINTVLNVADNTLDKLCGIALAITVCLLVFHLEYLVSLFPLLRY